VEFPQHGERDRIGKKTRVLVPTWIPAEKAREGGDWYFVKAMWNPSDDSTLSCLTNVFGRHDVVVYSPYGDSNAGLVRKFEHTWMKNSNGVRYEHWGEETALSIADEIAGCGARFAFVHPGE
jgi:hypothetical protein